MADDPAIERIARLLYETLVLRVCLDPERLGGWESQPEKLREVWRSLALTALQLARICRA